MAGEKKPELKFRYKISPNYVLHAGAGVYGGISAQGAIIMNLYCERPSIPRYETREIDEKGIIIEPPANVEREEAIIRDVPFGISLNPQTARSIGEWLISKADEFDNIVKQALKGEKQ